MTDKPQHVPDNYIEHGPGGTSFVGPSAVGIYRAVVIKHAIEFYARTGMKVNRAYTPTNMLAAASAITGQKFKRRDYAGAVAALDKWIDEERAKVPVVQREAQ